MKVSSSIVLLLLAAASTVSATETSKSKLRRTTSLRQPPAAMKMKQQPTIDIEKLAMEYLNIDNLSAEVAEGVRRKLDSYGLGWDHDPEHIIELLCISLALLGENPEDCPQLPTDPPTTMRPTTPNPTTASPTSKSGTTGPTMSGSTKSDKGGISGGGAKSVKNESIKSDKGGTGGGAKSVKNGSSKSDKRGIGGGGAKSVENGSAKSDKGGISGGGAKSVKNESTKSDKGGIGGGGAKSVKNGSSKSDKGGIGGGGAKSSKSSALTTASPTTLTSSLAPTMATTVQPTSSSTFIVPTWAKVVVTLRDSSTTRALEGVERTLQVVDEQCSAALKKTFEDLLLLTTDATDVTIASITQDEVTGDTIVVLTTSVDVRCKSSNCASTAEAAVSAAIEDSFSSGAFDAALATNLEGLDCPELTGLTYQSVDSTACADPNLCSGLDDITSCGIGEACLVTRDTTCPVYQCQIPTLVTSSPTGNPSSTPSANPTAGPSFTPSANPVTSSPTTSDPTVSPSQSPTTSSPTGKPSSTPSANPTAGPSANPTAGPSSTPSANPTVNPSTSLAPTEKCFASNDGGFRYPPPSRRHLQPQDPVPSSELSHRALQADEWKTWPCVPGTCVLSDAVHDYYAQDCDSDSSCEIGQVWGHPIGSWCVGSVVNMLYLFSPYAPGGLPNNITPDLSGWDTSSAEEMKEMFYGQMLFNGNLSLWDVSSATSMFSMFKGAESFDQDLLWDTSSVTNMLGMFEGASSFNGDLSQWDTSSVMYMTNMFKDASSFNSSSISNWDTSSVADMTQMFMGSTDFAQNLCPWKDAPAVQTGSTLNMFRDSSGQPKTNDVYGRFNATACD